MIDFIMKNTGRLSELLLPVLLFLAIMLLGLITRRIIFRRLSRWSQSTSTQIDDILISSTKKPFMIWCLMLAIYFAMEVSKLPDDIVHILGRVLLALGIASVTLAASSFTTKMIKAYSSRVDSTLPVTSLTQNLARIIVFIIGILIILSSLGISITPILATLGVGSLAVALGLQDTLTNLFAGFYVILSRQVRVGDYVKIESGEEGYITDINWRMTKIRMLPNNTVLVPNEKLTKSIIVNYYLPEKEMAVLINLGVHYDSDLARVEKVTMEVGKEIMKEVTGGVAEFEPFIRYHTFNAFSIDFSVILRAHEYVDQYLIKHEFVKRLHKRFAKEGIVIPYPIRAINYAQEKAET